MIHTFLLRGAAATGPVCVFEPRLCQSGPVSGGDNGQHVSIDLRRSVLGLWNQKPDARGPASGARSLGEGHEHIHQVIARDKARPGQEGWPAQAENLIFDARRSPRGEAKKILKSALSRKAASAASALGH